MDIICTNRLTASQTAQLAQLSRLCQAEEPISISCPPDGDRFYLLTDGTELIGALSVFFLENVWECYAFTRPDRRRQGCFTRLLRCLEAEAAETDGEPEAAETAEEPEAAETAGEPEAAETAEEPEAAETDGEPELCFITDGNSPDALKTLEALGAEFWYAEHAMEWKAAARSESLSQSGERAAFPPCGQPRKPHPVRLEMTTDPSRPSLAHFTARDSEGTVTGVLSLCIQSSCASLFRLEVPEPLRGQGRGQAMILALLDLLPAMGITRLILQVSGNNAPAISLYQKTGFRITETLSYYLY